MFRRKGCKDDVIRGQQEEIEAQNLLIEWLLAQTGQQRGEVVSSFSQTKSEVSHGHN